MASNNKLVREGEELIDRICNNGSLSKKEIFDTLDDIMSYIEGKLNDVELEMDEEGEEDA